MSVSGSTAKAGTSLVDGAFQLAYQCAYRLMKAYWGLRHPTTNGALVLLWNQGEVLLLRNSYVRYYSAPGGYMRRGESGRAAALRELAEEVGLRAREDELTLVVDETHEWEGKSDHVQIYSLELSSRPKVDIDNREVVEASWFRPEDALRLDLFPPLRRAIEKRLSA
jgi:8-oxo-dGTP pyrophosphatase MutT (NUDIX family)